MTANQALDGWFYLLKIIRLNQIGLRAGVHRRILITIASQRRVEDYRGIRIKRPNLPAQFKPCPVWKLITQYAGGENSALGQAETQRHVVGWRNFIT